MVDEVKKIHSEAGRRETGRGLRCPPWLGLSMRKLIVLAVAAAGFVGFLADVFASSVRVMGPLQLGKQAVGRAVDDPLGGVTGLDRTAGGHPRSPPRAPPRLKSAERIVVHLWSGYSLNLPPQSRNHASLVSPRRCCYDYSTDPAFGDAWRSASSDRTKLVVCRLSKVLA
jgi:hypothetical protein